MVTTQQESVFNIALRKEVEFNSMPIGGLGSATAQGGKFILLHKQKATETTSLFFVYLPDNGTFAVVHEENTKKVFYNAFEISEGLEKRIPVGEGLFFEEETKPKLTDSLEFLKYSSMGN